MEESGFHRLVGGFLAIMFAIVMGLCAFAVLYTDFTALDDALNDRERVALYIAASAAASAGLLAWGLQKFAAHRSFAVRLIYGLAAYVLVFCALGGLFELVNGIASNPGSVDWSPSSLFFLSLNDFYSFTLSLLDSSNILALIGLMLAAGVILAAVGPRTIY